MSNEYLLFICNDDADLDDDARVLFKTDAEKFLEFAYEQGIGTRYGLHYPEQQGDRALTEEQALLILKGTAFDDLWAKDDVLMVFRTPDGSITTWEYCT